MHISIRNLGVLKEAEIDLKPLTVFIGPNNSGKTWAAYTLFSILGREGYRRYNEVCDIESFEDVYPPLHSLIEKSLNEGNAKIDLVRFAEDYGEIYLQNVSHQSKEWIHEVTNARRISFKHLSFSISFSETKALFLEGVKARKLVHRMSVGRQTNGLVNAQKEENDPILYVYTKEGALEDLPISSVKEFIAQSVFEVLHRAYYSNVYVLPTERTTYITDPITVFPLPQRKRRKKQTSNLEISKKIEEELGSIQAAQNVTLSLIVSSFLDNLLSSYRSNSQRNNERKESNRVTAKFVELAHLMETEILGGVVDFSTPDPDPGREILFQPSLSDDISLEMPAVSSMVKELTPLALYLRYLMNKNELLIIDEPEMNLHPKAQVKMIEFLAMLVNAGLNILITTHSPYMVDHLVNLMKAAKHEDQEAIQDKFFLKSKDAFIKQESVSVHLFENGETQNILREDGLIDWETFGRISDQISEIYSEL